MRMQAGKDAKETDSMREIEMEVEELEERIAPGMRLANHNETLLLDEQDIDMNIEELEQIIAPGTMINHNQTFVSDDVEDAAFETEVEELESIIVPGGMLNHNETFVRDDAN